ncbi:MAG: 2-phospho-L-lactate transferase [Candidatus Acidiferrales bacterium]
MELVALAGGVGASKLLLGLARAIAPEDLTIIVNTGDDVEMHGLTICPDLDIVTYTLGGVVNASAGWGIDGDTFASLEFLGRYGRETWFHLGDRDLATHIHRSDMLRRGASLSQCADAIRRALGVAARILPMSDQSVRTQIETPDGVLPFQHYLVKHRAAPPVKSTRFEGAASAKPAPGVLEAIARTRGIVICPSNPLISIGPILAIPGIREALAARRDDVIAVCPIVGGMSLKGPSDKMMAELGHEVSALGVARMYRDIASRMVIDSSDMALKPRIEELGVAVEVTGTVMRTDEDKQRLGEFLMARFEERAAPARA